VVAKRNKHVAHHQLAKSRIKPRNINFRHYFGGAAFLLIFLQLITGLYMIFYYEPSLRDTYKTVQTLNNETYFGAFARNIHRYGAFFLVAAAFAHMARGYFRRDYQGGRKWNWLTGVALFLIVLSFTVSGSILPWEWKGYWMMEMVNNWLRTFPLVGEWLYNFFMVSYTPSRNFAVHDIILPILTFILLEIHCMSRMKKRGFWNNMLRQTLAALPVIVVVVALAVLYPVPTEDPAIIPVPMEGQYIPAPEWYFVTFLLPYWYLRAKVVPYYVFWAPLIFFTVLIALPYLNKRRRKLPADAGAPALKKQRLMAVGYIGAGAIVTVLLTGSLIWGSVKSPWMGCNSCHNVSMGDRMGIPPVTYKETKRNPLLLDNRWMMCHWYEPQVTW
jgi:quinol-cytochrome oxidoreductase complex cytochrome b subunit